MWYSVDAEIDIFCNNEIMASYKSTYLYESDNEESAVKLTKDRVEDFCKTHNENSKTPTLQTVKSIGPATCLGKELFSGMILQTI